MFILYDLVFLIYLISYLPFFLFKKKLHPDFRVRLGFLPEIPQLDRPIWIHAVSVGEAVSIKPLMECLREKFPQKNFIFSTITPAGSKIARSIAGKNDSVLYLPLDFSWIVRRVIAKINPSLFVIVETEIWPNLISCLYKNNIPIAVVNARISDQSFLGYSLGKFLFKPLLNKISIFCAQTETAAKRLAKLGVSADKIIRTGNMKFDLKLRDVQELRQEYIDGRRKLGLGMKEKIWIAASTHIGEEEDILKVYLNLSRGLSDFRLIIAPRHPQRCASIEKLVNNFPGLKAYRISLISRLNAGSKDSTRRPVFILDTIGQLMNFYIISDLVFVGGSLVQTGGHNILEPASLGKPVLFGKYMFNFREIAEVFIKNNAGLMVKDSGELEESLKDLLADKNRILQLGRAGREIILKNQGAAARNAEALKILTIGVGRLAS